MQRTLLWLLGIAIIMGVFFYKFCAHEHPPLKEKPLYGQITAKEWVPAYTSDYVMPMQSGDITIMIPMSDHVPDAYYLKVAGRIVPVQKEFFDKVQIGDMYGKPEIEK